VLKKLAPDTVTLCPADPLAGLSAEISGGPAGATGTVVDVDGVGAEVLGVVAPPAPLRGLVGGEWDGTVAFCPDVAAVEGGGAELPLNETINATAAATTSTATAVTEPISQRSRRAGGTVSPRGAVSLGSAGGRCSSRGGAASTRGGVDWARASGGGGSGGAPADSRARRTALSIAPRAR
jgi:hypothetical protein